MTSNPCAAPYQLVVLSMLPGAMMFQIFLAGSEKPKA
jgi:hypothetical protein